MLDWQSHAMPLHQRLPYVACWVVFPSLIPEASDVACGWAFVKDLAELKLPPQGSPTGAPTAVGGPRALSLLLASKFAQRKASNRASGFHVNVWTFYHGAAPDI